MGLHLSVLGLVLILVFGCLLLALIAELYYLIWWKKQLITTTNCNNSIEHDYTNHTKEMFYLFCWDKPNSITNPIPNSNSNSNPNSTSNSPKPGVDPDLEMGNTSSKDLLLKAFGEEGVEAELMRLHNLMGPPRFLFTIKEESKEDLESEDNSRSRKGSRTRSLGDLIVALESQTPFLSPMTSPTLPFKGTIPNDLGHLGVSVSQGVPQIIEGVRCTQSSPSPPPPFKGTIIPNDLGHLGVSVSQGVPQITGREEVEGIQGVRCTQPYPQHPSKTPSPPSFKGTIPNDLGHLSVSVSQGVPQIIGREEVVEEVKCTQLYPQDSSKTPYLSPMASPPPFKDTGVSVSQGVPQILGHEEVEGVRCTQPYPQHSSLSPMTSPSPSPSKGTLPNDLGHSSVSVSQGVRCMQTYPCISSTKRLFPNDYNAYNYSNPLFESTMEAELFRLRSSPPPKFKFLRDAEEKLYRRLVEEAQKSGILHEGISDNSHSQPCSTTTTTTTTTIEEDKDSCCSSYDEGILDISRESTRCSSIEVSSCSSQILPSIENKSSLH